MAEPATAKNRSAVVIHYGNVDDVAPVGRHSPESEVTGTRLNVQTTACLMTSDSVCSPH